MKPHWFKAKQYGWGWTPVTWQGWSVVLAYVGLILALVLTREEDIPGNPDSGSNFLVFALPIIILTALLIYICYKKGEKPRWQWGTEHAPLKLLIAIIICESAGLIGSIFTVHTIPTWYATLARPALNPPSWIFGPVWTTLYLLMGIAAFLIWKRGLDRNDVREALSVFGLQLILNASWSIVFFGLQSPAWAFAVIVAMWLAIIWTMRLFYKISRAAMWLLVPYILWVSFAMYLNYMIWILN